jgi:hypothetical protein
MAMTKNDRGRFEQQFGLRTTFFACDQNFCDRGGFRVGKQAVHLAHKIAAQRDQEKYAQATTSETNENGFNRVR